MNVLPELRAALVAAAARRYKTSPSSPPPVGSRMPGSRRWRPLALIGVLCLGGATGALAAAGAFRTGISVGASVLAVPNAFEGVAIPSTVDVLPLRVPDPDGGPPWALREFRTTRGLECVQPGRLVDGTIGVLGEDGAFHNDGRFHPLSNNAFEFTFNCGTLDANGHSFTDDIARAIPASGLEQNGNSAAGGCSPRSSLSPRFPRRLRHFHIHFRGQTQPVCPTSALRDIYFGMLGPDATRVTYATSSGHVAATPTAGPDGAYLVVLRHTPGPEGNSGGESGGVTLTAYAGNPIRGVKYTDGRTCDLPGDTTLAQQHAQDLARRKASLTARFPAVAKVEFGGAKNATPAALSAVRRTVRSAAFRAWVRSHSQLLGPGESCPTVGYVAPRRHQLTSAQVATPISARVETAKSYCNDTSTEIIKPCGATVPAGYQRVPASVARTSDVLVVTWTSRVAITNQDSHYEIYRSATPTAGRDKCGTGTSFGPTETNIRAGEKVTFTSWLPIRCPGISHGSVVLVQDTGPAGSIPVPAQPGEGPDIPVGKFSVTVP